MAKKRQAKTSKRQERQDARPFQHQTGRWCKKCRGKLVYLGSVRDDPSGEQAWLTWLEVRDDLRAGRTPSKHKGGLTVGRLANEYLTAKQKRVEAGELSVLTLRQAKIYTDLVVSVLGPGRRVDDLRPRDFAPVRAAMAGRWSPTRVKVGVVSVRSVFRWAWENELIAKPVRFGSEFNLPPARLIRQARNGAGPRMFSPAEIRGMLEVAKPVERTLILLAANCAMGATDLSALETAALDLENGWLDWPRRKTGIPRRIPLWPQTVDVVREWLDTRPPAKPGAGRYLLRNRLGRRLTARTAGTTFLQLAKRAGVTNRQFYDFRRTFATIGENAKDPAALSAIMGHSPRSDDMASVYRQRIEDERLRAVADVVRDWLFSGSE